MQTKITTVKHPITEEVGNPKCPHECGAMIRPIPGEPLEPDGYYCSECGHINGKCGDDCSICSSRREVC